MTIELCIYDRKREIICIKGADYRFQSFEIQYHQKYIVTRKNSSFILLFTILWNYTFGIEHSLYNSIHIWRGMCTSNIKIFCLTLKFHEVCFASNLTPTFNPYLIPKHYVTKQNIRLNVKYEDLFFLNGNPLSPNVLVGKSSMCPSICRSSA